MKNRAEKFGSKSGRRKSTSEPIKKRAMRACTREKKYQFTGRGRDAERERGRERAKESELKRARNSRGSVIERDKLWELN